MEVASSPISHDGSWLRGDDLIEWYRDHFGSRTILAFSCGKDSVSTALALRDKIEMVPVYHVIIPGLEFVERTLTYYERELFGCKIHRAAHGIGWNAIVNQCDMAPATAAMIERKNLRYLNAGMSNRLKRKIAGADLPIAVGIKAADSVQRHLSIKKSGPYTATSGQWYPVWDLKRADQVAMFKRSGIKLAIDYRI